MITQKVDIKQLYQHILQTEGIKHPIIHPEKLEQVASYISNEMKSYGLTIKEQLFNLNDINLTFKNIEGFFEDNSGPEILITSHYDTVFNSPGANDNGSGIAVMLESARIIAQEKIPVNIRFVSFTLEEGNPDLFIKSHNYAQELGLMDEYYRYTSNHTQKVMQKYYKLYLQALLKFSNHQDICSYILEHFNNSLTKEEKLYFEFLLSLTKDITPLNWVSTTGLIGSGKWVEKALEEGRNILGVINVETVGYTSTRAHSQILPSVLFKFFPKYKTNVWKELGNFIAIASDKQSLVLAKEFCNNCKRNEISLPYVSLRMPYNFKKLAYKLRDILRSDHAPFWRENIPALMITDTANFRYPYYHTQADTIDKLDFHFIKKVCQTTIATAITYALKKYNKKTV